MRQLYLCATFSLITGALLAGPLDVQVLDPHDLPIPGASVEARDPSTGRILGFARTDENGIARLEVVLPVRLTAKAPGFGAEAVHVQQQGSLTLRLRPAVVSETIQVVVSEPSLGFTQTVATAIEMDRSGARTVFDAVDRLVPSLFVTRRGIMGYGIATNGTGAVTIRGVGGSPNTGVLIVVDGRPDFQGLMGHPLPDFYSLSGAAEVTVTQGPASVLYGSNAMGGVIEIVSSQPEPGAHTRLSSSLGSFWTGQHRLAHGARWRKGFLSLHAGLDHTRGERRPAAYRSKDLTLGWGSSLGNSWKVSLHGRYGHFHVEDPGPVTAPLPNSYARVGRGGATINLDNAYRRTWGYLRAFRNQGRHFLTDGFRSVDSTTGGRLLQSFTPRSRVLVDVGAEGALYGGRARNVLTRRDFGRHEVGTGAGFARTQWNASERWRVRAGYRWERNSVFGNVSVPEIGASVQLGRACVLGASVAKGFRNPTIRELYLFPAPNPLLKPERMWNYQATLRAQPAPRTQFAATVYYADLDNLIVTVGRFPNIALGNYGSAIHKGIEFASRLRVHRRIQFDNGYAWLRSTNLPPFVPEQKWNSSLDLDLGRFFLHMDAITVGKRWANAARTYKLGGYTGATIKLTAPVTRRHRVFLSVDNVLDRRYEVIANYPMPGINAAFGLSLEF
ncbi:MAG: TonB-dependent receptor [Bryobacterales bacterium]|nr:TonB-dependent receptor [Bryobacteraceae bacterium]MDW8131052.1 TonB-dependent receptor [Bryobacterales bacterium]